MKRWFCHLFEMRDPVSHKLLSTRSVWVYATVEDSRAKAFQQARQMMG